MTVFNNVQKHVLATQTIEGKMMIADPSHEPDTWCALELEVKPGEWQVASATAETPEGLQCIRLEATHTEFERPLVVKNGKRTRVVDVDYVPTEDPLFEQYGARIVAVDTAQLGIFDAKQFSTGDADKRLGASYEATTRNLFGGKVEGGAVSTSGSGDGVYWPCVSRNEAGEIDFVVILFIEERDFEEEEEQNEVTM